MPALDALSSAAARAAAPVVAAVVCASCAAAHFTTISSHISINLMIISPSIFLNAVDQLVVPASKPRSCELNALVRVERYPFHMRLLRGD